MPPPGYRSGKPNTGPPGRGSVQVLPQPKNAYNSGGIGAYFSGFTSGISDTFSAIGEEITDLVGGGIAVRLNGARETLFSKVAGTPDLRGETRNREDGSENTRQADIATQPASYGGAQALYGYFPGGKSGFVISFALLAVGAFILYKNK